MASSAKAAVAFPLEVARLIVIEDDPQMLAEKLLTIIRKATGAPQMEVRRALESVFGDNSLKARLESLVQSAVDQGTACVGTEVKTLSAKSNEFGVKAGLTTR